MPTQLIRFIGSFDIFADFRSKSLPIKTLLTGLLVFIFIAATGQEYTYVRYDVKDGLPSKRVYAMCQDRDGFMWFATDNGICRFDGSDFKTFTTEDGLSDNDVVYVFCDSKNRVWLAPFKKEVCYYYKGKIYNRQNDPLLKNITLKGILTGITEDAQHNIWLMQEGGLYFITPANEVVDMMKQVSLSPGFMPMHIASNPAGGVWMISSGWNEKKESVILLSEYKDGRLQIKRTIAAAVPDRSKSFLNQHNFLYPNNENSFLFEKNATGARSVVSPLHKQNLNTISGIDDSLVMFNTGLGSFLYNATTGQYVNNFLNGKIISRSCRDNEGNLWFGTLDEGVYKLNSDAVRHIAFSPAGIANTEVFSILKKEDHLLAGLNSGMLAQIDSNHTIIYHLIRGNGEKGFDRVLQMEPYTEKFIACRSDKGLSFLNNDLSLFSFINSPVKSLFIDKNSYWASTTQDVRKCHSTSFDGYEKLLNERAMAIYVKNDSVYAATLDDLVLITPQQETKLLGDLYPVLKEKIVSIQGTEDGTIWISTYSNGVLAIKNNQLLDHLTVKNGLTSNNCKTAFVYGRSLWVGTDKGLNKIDLGSKNITRFTTGDGLPTDMINAVYADGNTIYIGTAAGLSWFDETKINRSSRCSLQLEKIMVDTIGYDAGEFPATLSYDKQNISFHCTAVSLKTAGGIIYSYRLRGYKDSWEQTNSGSVNFISLSSGHYVFEMFATNKAGVKSNVVSVPFTIATPFWRTTWFRICMIVLFGLIVWGLFRWRIKNIRKKEHDKTMVQQQIFHLEQKATRAQMNPHFIFNCINSIQHYIFSRDLESANNYISMFSHLIRQTLDNSDKTAIQLSEEIKYLETYMGLEQMRFSGKFSFTVSAAPGMQTDYVYIPSMLLQPYVENSIRHGVRYRRDNLGKINVHFYFKQDSLQCMVEDNGIGRKKAAELKSSSHIEYQSKGMMLTSERIEAIGKAFNEKINVEIIDRVDENKEAAGTTVIIHISSALLDKLNNYANTNSPDR